MLIVYRQAEPIPTGESFAKRDEFGQMFGRGEWCRANLIRVAVVKTWDEAKKLVAYPIVEVQKD